MSRGTKVSRPEGKDFPAAPEGLHPAVCVDVWEIWTEPRDERWGGGLVDRTRIIWQIDQTFKNEKGEEERYQVMQTYTASLDDRSNLYKHLKSWRGRSFSEDELKEFELENLVGVNCQLQIVRNVAGNGKTYANIAAIVRADKNAEKLIVTSGFVRRKDQKREDQHEQHDQEPIDESQFAATDDDVPF